MILSHTRSFLFFCNPKTGTTSLEAALEGFDESCGEDLASPGLFPVRHAPPAVVRSLLPQQTWETYFKFAFVRNPLDWVVSQYRWNFPPPVTYLKKLYWAPTRIRDTAREYMTFRRQIHQTVIDEPDVRFLHDFLRRFRCIPSYPTLYQSTYVFDADDRRIIDFVGRFEDMNRDVKQIADRIGTPIDVPHLNRSVRRSSLDTLTDRAIEAVYELWARDFELLGYERLPVEQLRHPPSPTEDADPPAHVGAGPAANAQR